MTKYYNKTNYKSLRQYLRNNSTHAEILLWKRLKNKQLCGYKFRRQYGVGNYIIDFYCPKLKLAIELDGSVHDSIDAIEYDKYRQIYLEAFKIDFIRFKNRNIISNMPVVLNELIDKIKSIEKSIDG